MKKWEYLLLGVSGNIVQTVNGKDGEGLNRSFFGPPGGYLQILDYLNWLGAIGWELAASNPSGNTKKRHYEYFDFQTS
jgi:hypothetical protein